MTRPQRPRVTVVGDVGLDLCCRLRAPIAAGDDTPAHITSHPGGAGANTAAGLARLGVEVELIARIGDDEAGRAAAVELASHGVDCRFVVDPTLPTCRVIVLVDAAGGRTMVSDQGANAALRPEDIVLPPGPGHLHLSGYVLLDGRSRAAGRAALERPSGPAGPPPSTRRRPPCNRRRRCRRTSWYWVSGHDLLLPNEAELIALGGPDAALAAAGGVAVTHGRDGASWYAAGDPQRVPVDRVTDTDSTGAGDAFDAGFLAAWLGGESPAVALAAGVRAGTEAAGAAGARDSPA